VLIPATLLCLAVLTWRAMAVIPHLDSRAVGDGSEPASYGFDLGDLRLPAAQLLAGGLPRDGLADLRDPPLITVEQARALDHGGHHAGKFLVPGDRVVGVTIEGHSVAYPLQQLQWHELVNTQLGGEPLLLSYSPLCDSVAVFRRAVAGELRSFGSSGLVYASQQLAYDRQSESLWSPLLGRAVAGPLAGTELEAVPFQLLSWEDWVARHPLTSVLARDEHSRKRRKRNPYGSYFGSDQLRFPVQPFPPEAGPELKERVTVLMLDGEHLVLPHGLVAQAVDEHGSLELVLGSAAVQLEYHASTDTLWVGSDQRSLRHAAAFWFAWYATHPHDRVWDPPRPEGG